MCPIVLELELSTLVEQYLDTRTAGSDQKSKECSLEDAQLKVDLCNVQPQIATPVYQLIMTSGLEIPFLSFNTTLNVVPGVSPTNGQISTQFAKSYSDITSIFITFGTAEYAAVAEGDKTKNETNGFFWPARSQYKATSATEVRAYLEEEDVVETQLHVGSKVMPQYPIRSLAEFAF
jgi:hypothetical protein